MTENVSIPEYQVLRDKVSQLCPPVRIMSIAKGIRAEYQMPNGNQYGFIITQEDCWEISIFPMSDTAFQSISMVATGWERVIGRRLWRIDKFALTTDQTELSIRAALHIANAQGKLNSLIQSFHEPESIPCCFGGYLNGNFGDMLAPFILEKILGHPVHQSIHEPSGHAYVTVGSLLNTLTRGGMAIWGTGCIRPFISNEITKLARRPPARLLALRGYLTYAEVAKLTSWKLDHTVQIGDPAFVLPLIYPVSVATDEPPLLLLHYRHRSIFERYKSEIHGFQIMYTDEISPRQGIQRIASARVIISTSLHGVIVAHAYGRPWLWLDISDHPLIGEDFKFADFGSVLCQDIDEFRYRISSDDIRNIPWAALTRRAQRPNDHVNANSLLNVLLAYATDRGDLDATSTFLAQHC